MTCPRSSAAAVCCKPSSEAHSSFYTTTLGTGTPDSFIYLESPGLSASIQMDYNWLGAESKVSIILS